MKNLAELARKGCIVVSHLDIDGIASAAIAKLAFPNAELVFSNYDEETLRDSIAYLDNLLAKMRFGLAIVLDLSINAKSAMLMEDLLSKLKQHAKKLIYLDHHAITKEQEHLLRRYADFYVAGEDPNNCGATLAYGFLFKGASPTDTARKAHKLAIIGEIADFGLFSYSEMLHSPIKDLLLADMSINTNTQGSSFAERNQMFAKLALELAENAEDLSSLSYAKKLARVYEKEIDRRAKEMLKHSFYFNLGRVKLAIGYILDRKNELDSVVACALLKDKYEDSNLQVYIRSTGVRMRSYGINTLPLAQAFGGGGHPGASGFDTDFAEFNHLSTKKDIANFVKYLVEKIRDLLQTPSNTKIPRSRNIFNF